jgi:hypothetical protein
MHEGRFRNRLSARKGGLRAGHHKIARYLNSKSKITFISLPDTHSSVWAWDVSRHTEPFFHSHKSMPILYLKPFSLSFPPVEMKTKAK